MQKNMQYIKSFSGKRVSNNINHESFFFFVDEVKRENFSMKKEEIIHEFGLFFISSAKSSKREIGRRSKDL